MKVLGLGSNMYCYLIKFVSPWVQVDDTEMVHGLVFDHKASHMAGGPTRIENAKIGLIQFQISPPKTDIEQNVIVSAYTQVSCFHIFIMALLVRRGLAFQFYSRK